MADARGKNLEELAKVDPFDRVHDLAVRQGIDMEAESSVRGNGQEDRVSNSRLGEFHC